MSLFGLFDIGKSTIFSSQTALNVISNNIANVNTPGYSRHEAILEIANPVQIKGNYIGRGVGSVEIRRHYDKFLNLQLIGQNQSYGRSYSIDRGLSYIEQVFNEAQDLGLQNPLQNYFNAWQEVSSNPESQPQRTSLLQTAGSLVQTAQQMESDIKDTLKYINEDIANVATNINSLTSQIAEINGRVAELEAGLSNEEATYFRDERDRLLYELAELTEYTSYEDSNGYVTVLVGGKTLVSTVTSYDLTTQVDIDGDTNVYLNGQDITSVFQKGQIGGLIDVRDDIENNSLHDLRKLVASVIKETNFQHSQGYGLDGSTNNDFFDALQAYTKNYSSTGYVSSSSVLDSSALTLDEYNINFVDAANYEVYNRQTGALVTSGAYVAGGNIDFEGLRVVIDGAPAANDSFLVSPLSNVIENFNVAISDTEQIAAASSDPTTVSGPGDNGNAILMVQIAQSDISDLNNNTFESYYQGIVSDIGIMSKAAADSLSYDDNLLYELQSKRDAVAGVSLDEEATNLIRFQRAYEAGAKIIQITDELLEVIINL